MGVGIGRGSDGQKRFLTNNCPRCGSSIIREDGTCDKCHICRVCRFGTHECTKPEKLIAEECGNEPRR
jgi:hypothetical protein